MYKEMLKFLDSQRVSVLAVQMPDNYPHAATLHFAHKEDPLTLIFSTNKNYKKCEPLTKDGTTKASVVVGVDDTDMRTLQLDGTVAITEDQQLEGIYFDTFPEKVGEFDGPEDIFLRFELQWWRYTDWTKPEGKTVLTSDGKERVVG